MNFYELQDKFKETEVPYTDEYLPNNSIAFIRIDGKSFSSWTRQFDSSFNNDVAYAFQDATKELCNRIQNAKFGFTFSDEITIVMHDLASDETQHWFGGKLHKINSVAASIASVAFNSSIKFVQGDEINPAYFDARVFTVNKEDVVDCLVWRQQDCRRNAVSALAQEHFSKSELHGKGTGQRLEMLADKDVRFNDLDKKFRAGSGCYKVQKKHSNEYGTFMRSEWLLDEAVPYFHEQEEFILEKIFD